mmetsp:Transcript_52596/g.122416  ORF Transcript_52596/g.122416 Transcript_52596/m.122416 type:complete len:350 (-) Transcript_52596:501-1550(-)
MAQDAGEEALRVCAAERVDVGVAKRVAHHLHADLALLGRRNDDFLEAQVVDAKSHHGLADNRLPLVRGGAAGLVVECGNARQHLALKQLQRRPAACGDKVDLLLHTPLGRRRGGVSTSNNATSALLRELSHGFQQRLRAFGEVVKLENACRAIPDNCLRSEHHIAEEAHGLRAAVHALPAFGNALGLGHHLHRLVVLELLTAGPVNWQHDFDPFSLGLLHELGRKLSTVLVEERLANFHAKADFHEGVGHAAAEDELVGLVNEVLDDQHLVRNLGSSDNGRERPLHLRRVEDLRERLKLLVDEQACNAWHQPLHTNHRGVCPVRCAKGVIHVDIAELAERGTEGRRLLF